MNRHVRIHNNTSTTMEKFYASNVGASNYEEDILGSDVIASGDAWNINIDDGTGYCKYDFLAVFDDGSQAKKDNVNVCKVGDFYFDATSPPDVESSAPLPARSTWIWPDCVETLTAPLTFPSVMSPLGRLE